MTSQTDDLISLIEGVAPTLASVIVPGPLGGAAGALTGVAIAHLADALGLPHPATKDEITAALSGQPKPVQDAVLARAEASFQTALAPAASVGTSAPAPTSRPAEPTVVTHTGVTTDLPTMVVFMGLTMLSGWLAHKGVSVAGFQEALTGSTDLHVGAAVLVGAVTAMWRQVRGSNANTLALAGKS